MFPDWLGMEIITSNAVHFLQHKLEIIISNNFSNIVLIQVVIKPVLILKLNKTQHLRVSDDDLRLTFFILIAIFILLIVVVIIVVIACLLICLEDEDQNGNVENLQERNI